MEKKIRKAKLNASNFWNALINREFRVNLISLGWVYLTSKETLYPKWQVKFSRFLESAVFFFEVLTSRHRRKQVLSGESSVKRYAETIRVNLDLYIRIARIDSSLLYRADRLKAFASHYLWS